MPLPTEAEIGSRTPFSLIEPLSSGPHARVWRALGPDGPVALKQALSAPARARLKAEYDLLRRLDHPALVRPVAVAADGAWLATAWVTGQGIEGWARGRDPAAVLQACAQVADGLAALHALGACHGDIKPANLRVDAQDRVVLLDLGVAVAAAPGFHGTPAFAAPEQLSGGPLQPASDAFALGVTLFQLLTGGHPFSSARAAPALVPRLRLPWTPGMVRPGLPEALDALVLRLLHRDPRRRPADLGAVAQALRQAPRSPARSWHPLVFARWRVVGRWLVQAQDQRDGGILVLLGPAGPAVDDLCALWRLAATVEGGSLAAADGPWPPGAFTRLDGPEAVARALELRAVHRGRVLIRLPRPDPRLLRAGATHVRLDADWASGAASGRDSNPEDEVCALIFEELALGPLPVTELARRLALSPLDLLEAAEPLLSAGRLEEREGGRCLAVAISASTARSARERR